MNKIRKFLWIDTETTGLDPKINAPYQVAGELLIDGVSVEVFDLKFRPRDGAIIEASALIKTFPDMSFEEAKEELMKRPLSSIDAYVEFNKVLFFHINKRDKQDKAIFCAYNAGFDAQMVNQWYVGHGNDYFFALCHGGAYFDPLQLALLYELKLKKRVFMPDRKLVTVAKYFGLDTEGAHDAAKDILMTRNVAKILWKAITCSSEEP